MLSKFAHRFGIPALILFLFLGMIFGSDGIFKIHFDDYQTAQVICSVALLLIIFNGGFSTNWQKAKSHFKPSIVMSTAGTLVTALITGGFCFYVLKMNFWEAMLIGSVLSSTDAASVFSILKSNHLNFKHGLASLLEMESGSNDPIAYLLTIICIQMMTSQTNMSFSLLFVQQFVFGIGLGLIFSFATIYVLKKIELSASGLYPIFMLAIVLLSYELCMRINGNGFLCVYLIGILVGNTSFPNRKFTVQFFDGIGWLMQILLFFTLGLFSYPSKFMENALAGILIALFITFVSRPVACAFFLTPFKMNFKEQILVSWVGFRGAASITFAILAASAIPSLENDLFHIVFLVSIFTVLFQGSLLSSLAKKLDLVEEKESVFKTFNDYEEGHLSQLYEIRIDESHAWQNMKIKEACIDKNMLIIGVKRKNKMLMPKGSLRLKLNDILIFTKNE